MEMDSYEVNLPPGFGLVQTQLYGVLGGIIVVLELEAATGCLAQDMHQHEAYNCQYEAGNQLDDHGMYPKVEATMRIRYKTKYYKYGSLLTQNKWIKLYF